MGEEPIQAGCRGKTSIFFISFSTAFFKSPQGDKLYGRGTTDCLGHVALLTQLFIELAIKKPTLKREVWAVVIAWYVNTAAACKSLHRWSFSFLCSEENSTIPGVGVDQLLKNGKLEKFRNGPVYWLDSADSNPRIGQ